VRGFRLGVASGIALLATFLSTSAWTGDSPAPLRLCADPDNLPFTSNAPATPGLYVELAQHLAAQLNRSYEPVWASTYMAKRMLRETLLARKCDLFIGLPNIPDLMGPRVIVSRPLMDVGFALVTPLASTIAADADLIGKRIAAQYATQPQHWLASRTDITLVTVMSPEEGMRALKEGRVDAALLWGPSAGYLNKTELREAYRVVPVQGEQMQSQTVIGFAKNSAALRDQVDRALADDQQYIDSLKRSYGFPDQPPIALLAPSTAVVKVAVSDAGADQKVSSSQAPSMAAPGAADASPPPSAAAGSQSNADNGRLVFNINCSHCHGSSAVQPLARIDLRLLRHRYGAGMDEMFHTTVTHGRTDKGMPNWSGILTEQDFADILAWLHAVQNE
jgi:polar amino acid transport system substrate-binding protein